MADEKITLSAADRAHIDMRERELRESVRLRCLEIAANGLRFTISREDSADHVADTIERARRLEAYVNGNEG